MGAVIRPGLGHFTSGRSPPTFPLAPLLKHNEILANPIPDPNAYSNPNPKLSYFIYALSRPSGKEGECPRGLSGYP